MYNDVDVGAIMEVVDRALEFPFGEGGGFYSIKSLRRFFVPLGAVGGNTRNELIFKGFAYGILYTELALWITDVPTGERLSVRGVLFDDEQESRDFAKHLQVWNYVDLAEQIRYLMLRDN